MPLDHAKLRTLADETPLTARERAVLTELIQHAQAEEHPVTATIRNAINGLSGGISIADAVMALRQVMEELAVTNLPTPEAIALVSAVAKLSALLIGARVPQPQGNN